jgi:hypothetical protein
MQDSSTVMGDYEKTVEQAESRGRKGEEVHSGDCLSSETDRLRKSGLEDVFA